MHQLKRHLRVLLAVLAGVVAWALAMALGYAFGHGLPTMFWQLPAFLAIALLAGLLSERVQGRERARRRESEARQRALLEQLPFVVYTRPLDPEAGFSFVSVQAETLLGYSAEELMADRGLFLGLVDPDEQGQVLAERARALGDGQPTQVEYRLRARDGRMLCLADQAVVIRDGRGHPLYLQGYLRDISEQRRAEEERLQLQAAEQAAQAETERRQQRLELVSQAALLLAATLDYKPVLSQLAKLVVRNLAEWCLIDVLQEDGTLVRLASARATPATGVAEPSADPEQTAPEVLAHGATVTETRIAVPLVSRNQRTLGVLTLLAPRGPGYRAHDLASAQALASLLALAIDNGRLYEELESRADATRVLASVADGIFLVDQLGVVRLWNPAAAAITGLPASAVLDKQAAEVLPGWPELVNRIPLAGPHEQERAETVAVPFPRAGGEGERWLSISGVAYLDGVVYAFRDTSEEQRLKQLQAEFIATASHELRTPLAAVYGAAQTLRRHDFALDETGRERFISLIVEESERLGRIVNQILIAKQLDVGRVEIQSEPFDAAELIRRLAEATKLHTPPDIRIEVALSRDELPVAADRDQVRQILGNLVENAIKYSPDGGRIEIGAEPAAAGMVRFRVVDEGLGIPAEERSRIFDKFYRLDPQMTGGVGGTGLGLYISSELVSRMGGRIWVEEGPRGGSAFFYELPAAPARLAAPQQLATTGSERAARRAG